MNATTSGAVVERIEAPSSARIEEVVPQPGRRTQADDRVDGGAAVHLERAR